ncbi:MAG TPA: lytic transglycosylase domain-containing protein [Kiritimatiellia bacterium]|nr:lytic transglycosylase domain-containing protein [Kiritimatiellia bacterium]HRZ12101.1 lytic transglycosylase domain-containing protein [Kiritimatiellia bacterium]HSA18141.1 lytic transglycosylase domain-containing protein [Kiritimatiellia bacterium]
MNWKQPIGKLYRHAPAIRAALLVFGSALLLAQLALGGWRSARSSDAELADHQILSWSLEAAELSPVWVPEDCLVEAVIQVESGGDPRKVGKAGERGLMQIKRGTWRDVTRRLYGKPVSFDRAFEPELNRIVGRAYLAHLQDFLGRNQSHWKTDELSLLLACYNAGPTRVAKGGFHPDRWPVLTREYVQRVTALHEHYLAEGPPSARAVMAQVPAPRPPGS